MEKLISINDAAKMLGISHWSLRRYSEDAIKPIYSAKIYGRRSHMTKKNKENEDKQSI